MNQLRLALRQLARAPGFTLIAVAILTLGLGANTLIFTLVNAIVLKPIGGRDPARLVGIYSEDTARPGSYRSFSYPNFVDLRANRDVFEDAYAFTPGLVGVREGETTRRQFALNVSANFFSVFGTPVSQGRDFRPEDEMGGVPVAIVTHSWWVQHGADPGIIGSALQINGKPYTVIGVAGREFTGTVPMFPAEIILPLYHSEPEAKGRTDRAQGPFMLVGRLKPGLDLTEANARLAVASSQLAQAYPAENKDQRIKVAPVPRTAFSTNPQDDRSTLGALTVLLLGMSSAVLIIACLNLANLLMARGAARRKEMAIRLALGASRAAILRQLVVEGGLLAILGGALGLLLGGWASGGLVSSLNAIAPSPLTLDTRPDVRVLLAAMGFCGFATVLFALGPAWKLARLEVNADLKEHAGEDLGFRRGGLFAARHLLVIAQVALSLALLVAAGLFTRGAMRATNVDPGFSLDRGFYIEMDPGLLGYSEQQARQRYQEILERVRVLPGVEAATLAATVPLGEVSLGEGVQRAGAPVPPPAHAASPAEGASIAANYNVISPDYFKTLGVGLQRGREFEPREFSTPGLPRVAIINSVLAEKLWPGEDALGKRLQFSNQGGGGEGIGTFLGSGQAGGRGLEVVGVVSPFRAHLSDHQPAPMVFVPFAQDYRSAMTLHVRVASTVNEASMIKTVRETIHGMDPTMPILVAKTLRYHLQTNIQVWIINAGAWLFAALGVTAMLLAVIGVYGVKAYTVARRTREIGIRMALGASRDAVLRMMVKEGMTLTGVGLALGLLVAAGVAKALSRFLFEVQPYDPVIFIAAPLLISLAGLLAAWLPARRAARVDPVIALRSE